ncbi:MAG TPA: extracellular solute-binding protein [Trueperaceae bacterium]
MERHAIHVGPSTLAGGILRSVAATAVAAGLALACAQGMDASGDLRVLGFGLPDEIATVRVDTFEAAYPDVNLEITEGAIDQQQLLTAIASGRPPDVVYLNRDDLSTYATRGALQPLDQCIEQAGIDMSQFRPAATQPVTIDGTVYGIPEFNNVILMIINTAALEEAGLTLEDVDTSDWDAIAALNEQLTTVDGSNVTRIGFDPKLPEFFPLWVRANGGQLVSDDGRTAMLNSPEAIEALEFTAGLHEAAGGRGPFMAFRDTWDFFGAQNQVAANQIGAWPMEQWYVNVLVESSPDAPVAFAPFLDRQGNPLSFATGSAWAIPTGAANPEAACAWMATMTSADTWYAAASERAGLRADEGRTYTGTYTGNLAADERIFGELVQDSGNDAFDNGVDVILQVQDAAFSIPANPAGAQVRQAWTDAVNRVLNGEQTAEEALTQAQEEAQAALDEAWEQ